MSKFYTKEEAIEILIRAGWPFKEACRVSGQIFKELKINNYLKRKKRNENKSRALTDR
jgi:hypothetical protein